jgi:hypothetical protein
VAYRHWPMIFHIWVLCRELRLCDYLSPLCIGQ